MVSRRVLVAYDCSPLSARCLDVAAELARSLNADLGIVTVVNPRDAISWTGGMAAAELLSEMRVQAQRRLEGVRGMAPCARLALRCVAEGDPVREILRAADDWGADLLVRGAHLHGGIAKLISTTSEAVARRAHRPVLLVPA